MKKSYLKKLEGKEWEKCIQKSFKKNTKDLTVDGFRKGSVPYDVYVKKYGVESLYMDALDEAMQVLYKELLDDKDTIIPVCTPTVDVKAIDEKHVEVEYTLVSNPEIKLGKYKDLGIKKEEAKVTKEEVEHELFHLKQDYAELKSSDKKIAEGDVAVIDFEGFKDGKAFEGGKGENYSLTIGSHSFIPGFEESLVGLSKGEEKDLNLTFPENYHVDDLKGKEVVFKVKVNEVKERIVPELNEDFFKDLGMEGIDSEEKLRKELEENIKASKEREIEEKYILETLDAAIKNAKFEVPEEMITDECDRIYEEFSRRLQMQGMDIKEYLKVISKTEEEIKAEFKEEASKRISYRLIVDAVSDEENIKFTDKEIDEEAEKLAKRYGMDKEDLIKNMGGKEMISYDMKMRKALEIITGIKKEEN